MPVTARNVKQGGITPSRISNFFNADPWSRTLFVSSTHLKASDVGNAGTLYDRPLKTLKQALAQSKSGDLILVGEAHAETVTTADGLNIPSTKTGIKIVGLGEGQRRPKFTFTTLTTADMMISGAGAFIDNLWFHCGIDAQVAMMVVAAADCSVQKCLFTQDATNQALLCIDVQNGAHRLRCVDCEGVQTDVGTVSFMKIGTPDKVWIENLLAYGDYSTSVIDDTTGVATNLAIVRCFLENRNAVDLVVGLNATTTGFMSDCRLKNSGEATETASLQTAVTATTSFWFHENYHQNTEGTAGETGLLLGVPAT